MKKKVIAFVGGGTGGHIYPGLNVLEYIQAKNSDARVYWVGERCSLEKRIISQTDLPFYGVTCGKLRRYLSWWTFLVPFQILVGIAQSLLILTRTRTTHIFSK